MRQGCGQADPCPAPVLYPLACASMRREATVFLISLIVKGLSWDRLELARGAGPLLRHLVGLRHVSRAEAQIDEAAQFGGRQVEHIGIPPATVQLGLARHAAPEAGHFLFDLQHDTPGPSLAKIKTSRQSHVPLLNSCDLYQKLSAKAATA